MEKTKKCIKCGNVFNLSMFSPEKRNKDKLKHYCKNCSCEYTKQFSRKKEGLLYKIYRHQVSASIHRGHEKPQYTYIEFKEKYINDISFIKLYDNWVDSGYKKELSPSFDRLNDNLGYSFDNLNRWMTWDENNKKANSDIRSGKLKHGNKPQRPILQFKNGIFIDEFPSNKEAHRKTNIARWNIHSVCNGKRKTAGGYEWKYK